MDKRIANDRKDAREQADEARRKAAAADPADRPASCRSGRASSGVHGEGLQLRLRRLHPASPGSASSPSRRTGWNKSRIDQGVARHLLHHNYAAAGWLRFAPPGSRKGSPGLFKAQVGQYPCSQPKASAWSTSAHFLRLLENTHLLDSTSPSDSRLTGWCWRSSARPGAQDKFDAAWTHVSSIQLGQPRRRTRDGRRGAQRGDWGTRELWAPPGCTVLTRGGGGLRLGGGRAAGGGQAGGRRAAHR